ncbi:MerR family transcriptional regulator [Limosilactobacillus difficilis]|uniref:MerR family transcriptional regulator n=1 Tax=Limosilactobacillus difficilis TaxID=2991838 RepID=UPI0024BB9CC2|nr:MerR family transcriptional regulator [Limosilactobacillus difficilis]
MNIKQVSEQLDVPRETLRYWESVGLLPKVPRNSSGYRNCTENEIKWVLFIKSMRKAGMSVESLIDFVKLYREHQDSRAAQKSLVQEQYDQLVARRNELNKTINYLKYKLDHFDKHVIPFLEEQDYYELRKKVILDDQDD